MARKPVKKTTILNDRDNEFDGGAVRDIVSGNGGDDTLYGGGGDDRLSGGAGDDLLFGEAGNDLLDGDDGNDDMEGGEGNDTLRGGAGNDVLDGGAGMDILRGNGGADIFSYRFVTDSPAIVGTVSMTGSDLIADFRSGTDKIDVTGLGGLQGLYFSGGAAAASGLWLQAGSGEQLVLADTSGDGVADFAIRVTGSTPLALTDFIGLAATPPAGTVTINKITDDNILTQAEASGTIAVTGSVRGAVKPGDTVTVTVGGSAFAGQLNADLTFSVPVTGTALLANAGRSVSVAVTAKDNAALSLGQASASYETDLTGPSISAITFLAADGTAHDGTFRAGESLLIKVSFSGPVTITTGTPSLLLDNGATASLVTVAPDGRTMIFSVDVEKGDDSAALGVTRFGNGLVLSGIEDGNPADITIGPNVPQLARPVIDTEAPEPAFGYLYESDTAGDSPLIVPGDGAFSVLTPFAEGGGADPGGQIFLLVQGPDGDPAWGAGGTHHNSPVAAVMDADGGWHLDFAGNDGLGVPVPDLTAAGTYSVQLVNVDAAGNVTLSGTFVFNHVIADYTKTITGTAFDDVLSSSVAGAVIRGLDGADRIAGGDDSQQLDGGEGDDGLIGSRGQDQIIGGNGIDLLSYVSLAGADVTVNLVTGTATKTYADTTAETDEISGIEDVFGSQGNDQIIGNGDDNLLVGFGGSDGISGGNGGDWIEGRDGSDQLSGNDGDDTLNGGAGDDVMLGGDGNDTVVFDTDADLTVDLDIMSQQNTGDGNDLLQGIENAVGGTGDDELIGDENDNRLSGYDGDDVLNGRVGDDVLIGGFGDDDLDGADGIDTASYLYASQGVVVSLAVAGWQDTKGAGFDRLMGIENLEGSYHDDVLTGDENDNILYGRFGDDILSAHGEGADKLYGDEGDDILIGNDDGGDRLDGGTGRDLVSYEELATGLGVIVSLDESSSPQIAMIVAGTNQVATDALFGIEDAVGSRGNDSFYGNDDTNDFDGGDGDDFLDGGLGADTLTGGNGADTFFFSTSNSAIGDGYPDTITDFSAAEDVIVTNVPITGLFIGTVDDAMGVLTDLYGSDYMPDPGNPTSLLVDLAGYYWPNGNIQAILLTDIGGDDDYGILAINADGSTGFSVGDIAIYIDDSTLAAAITLSDFSYLA